jgi:agmatinase
MIPFLDFETSCKDLKDARVVLIPFPLEFSTSYGKGTIYGPEAILRVSPYLEFYDEELDLETWKIGIYTAPQFSADNNPDDINLIVDQVSKYLAKNKFITGLGGEHTITYGIYQAFRQKFKNLSILQLDAHSDLRDEYEGLKISHACVMRRIWELGTKIVQVGIRSQSYEEKLFAVKNDIEIYYAYDLRKKGFPQSIINNLTENVFITMDVDFFDPSVMPSTGAPEPGGFFWDETIEFLTQVFQKRKVVGFDVVELSPIHGIVHPEFFIAKFIYKLIGIYYKNNPR